MTECKAIFEAPSKSEAFRRFRAWSKRWRVEAERVLFGERFLSPAALLRLSAGAVEKDPHDERAGETLPRASTTDAADAGVSEPGECGENLLRRDRLPQPELGGAASMTKFHKIPCITASPVK